MDDGFDLDMNAVKDYVVLKAQYPTVIVLMAKP